MSSTDSAGHAEIHLLWRDRAVCRRFRTGVSLHSHTMHSRENLAFIPRYTSRVPPLAWELCRLARCYQARYGRTLDYSRGYWTPPLPERQAHDLEKSHIENGLGLTGLVSLSDHDDIEAGCRLRQSPETADAPISVEWTVPADGTYFHVGVHNLPPGQARSIATEMGAYTRTPSEELFRDILEAVNAHPDTLVVLNHPLWDQSGSGAGNHSAVVAELLRVAGKGIHALEWNGLRTPRENRGASEMARNLGYPLVSGGDRHACEPNCVMNLTNAADFSEFAAEVRAGHSVVAVEESYREPRGYRIAKALSDIMGEYPDLPSRVHWSDRVFCRRYTGDIVPISAMWNGNEPKVVRLVDRAARLARGSRVRIFMRQCFGDRFEIETPEPRRGGAPEHTRLDSSSAPPPNGESRVSLVSCA